MFPYYFVVPACFSIVCIASGILTWKYLPLAGRIILINCCCTLLADVAGKFVPDPRHNSHIIFNILLPVDYLLLFAACRYLIPKTFRNIYTPIFLSIFVGIFVASIYHYGIRSFANMAMVCGSFLITVGYLRALFQAEMEGGDTRPVRLLCLSVIIYYCCSAPLYAAMAYLIEHDKNIPAYVYDISPLLSCFKTLMISAAFFHFKRAQLFPAAKKVIGG